MKRNLKFTLTCYKYTIAAYTLSILLLAVVMLIGCPGQAPGPQPAQPGGPTDQPPPLSMGQVDPAAMQMQPNAGEPIKRQVVEPPEVREQFSSVRLEVAQRDGAKPAIEIEASLGGSTVVPGTDPALTVEVLHFLPAFVMSDDSITSVDMEPINPAVHVKISGEQDWEGWLFSQMPDVHPYPGTKYAVRLLGFTRRAPAGQ